MREQADFLVNNNKSVQRTLVVGGPFMSTDKYPSTHVCISAPNGRYGLYNMEQILPIKVHCCTTVIFRQERDCKFVKKKACIYEILCQQNLLAQWYQNLRHSEFQDHATCVLYSLCSL